MQSSTPTPRPVTGTDDRRRPASASTTGTTPADGTAAPASDSLIDPELSQLRFYARVLEEAEDVSAPLLERVRFLAILASNIDEFLAVRGPGLRTDPTRRIVIDQAIGRLVRQAGSAWRRHIEPALAREGIAFAHLADLDPDTRADVDRFVAERVRPSLTITIVDGRTTLVLPAHGLHFAVELRDGSGTQALGIVCVPHGCSPIVPVHHADVSGNPVTAGLPADGRLYVWLDDAIDAYVRSLFPAHEVLSVHRFRIVRQADPVVEPGVSIDPVQTAAVIAAGRRDAHPIVLLAVDAATPSATYLRLAAAAGASPDAVARVPGLHNPQRYWEVSRIARPDLRYAPMPAPLEHAGAPDIFGALAARDLLLHHPRESFAPVVELIRQASVDPDVTFIAITLYRFDRESAIGHALLEALKRGKRVQVVVELAARYDEAHNARWARAFEDAGARVVVGAPELKIHAKFAIVERHEAGGLRRYAHVGSGNYHAYNSLHYTDLSLLTADPAITLELRTLFAALDGPGAAADFQQLLVAPLGLRGALTRLVEREIAWAQRGVDAHVVLKTNALVDPEVIRLLYAASGAGVRIDLIVRGMCCLRPGVPGLSDRITVRSVVGRFLEHSRVWYFRNGGQEAVFVGSADCRPVNLDRRLEVMAPVRDRDLAHRVRDEVLGAYLADNTLARTLNADGSYTRLRPARHEQGFSSQAWWSATGRYPGGVQ